MKKYTSFYKNYFSSCDLLNKYLPENVYKIPRIKKITFFFSLKNFSKAEFTELECFLFFYLFFGLPTFLSFKLLSANKNLDKSESGIFSFKVTLKKKYEIEEVIQSLMLKKLRFIDKNNYLYEEINNLEKTKITPYFYNFEIVGEEISNIRDSFFSQEKNASSGELKLRFHVSLNYFNNCTYNKSILLNVQPFWMNGRVA